MEDAGIPDILSDEFTEIVVGATKRAQQAALAAGHYITYQDLSGIYVREMPDGRLFEIRFRPEGSGEDLVEIVREITPVAA